VSKEQHKFIVTEYLSKGSVATMLTDGKEPIKEDDLVAM
jgi:hypothetical protein